MVAFCSYRITVSFSTVFLLLSVVSCPISCGKADTVPAAADSLIQLPSQTTQDTLNGSSKAEYIKRIALERDRMKESVQQIKREREKYNSIKTDYKLKKYFIVSICLITFLGLLYAIFYYFKRRILQDKILTPVIQPEKKRLQNLLLSDIEIDDDTKATISETISLFTSILSEKDLPHGLSDRNKDKIKKLAADKTGLMTLLTTSYSLTHPVFVSRLKNYNLTDTEIGYCCLYASGLKGKDISFLLNNGGHSHYNMASTIRAKIGLKENDTNLSIHIKSMLTDNA